MNTIIKKSLQSLLLVPVIALGVSVVAPTLQPMAAYADTTDCGTPSGIQNGLDCARGTDQTKDIFGSGGLFGNGTA